MAVDSAGSFDRAVTLHDDLVSWSADCLHGNRDFLSVLPVGSQEFGRDLWPEILVAVEPALRKHSRSLAPENFVIEIVHGLFLSGNCRKICNPPRA